MILQPLRRKLDHRWRKFGWELVSKSVKFTMDRSVTYRTLVNHNGVIDPNTVRRSCGLFEENLSKARVLGWRRGQKGCQIDMRQDVSCYFKCMMISVLVNIVGAEHVVGMVSSDLARQEICAINRDKMSCAEDTINMDNRDIWRAIVVH